MTLEERLARHLGCEPQVDASAYVARDAVVIGDVRIGPRASVWHGCVLRGDINVIEVGEASNVQDGTIVHLSDDFGVRIGKFVTIGHAAVVHACTIEDGCLIGMHSTVLDGAVVGAESIVGANALVTQGTVIPPGSLALGAPAKVVRALSAEERQRGRDLAEKYVIVSAAHRSRREGRR